MGHGNVFWRMCQKTSQTATDIYVTDSHATGPRREEIGSLGQRANGRLGTCSSLVG